MSDTLASKTKSLFVVHNLSSENLKHAVELGGLAAPSLAIARDDIPFDNFGEISLIGDPDMANPRNGATRVFAADAYSPRQPRAQFDIFGKGYDRMEERLAPVAHKIGTHFSSRFSPDKLSREGLSLFEHSDIGRMAFLEEIGDAPRVIYKKKSKPDSRLLKFRGSRQDLIDNPEFAAVALELVYEDLNERTAEVREVLEPRYLETKDGVTKVEHNKLVSFVNELMEYRGPRQVDGYETSRAIQKKISKTQKREAEYLSWVKKSFGHILTNKFFMNEDYRRRPYNMKNILREMNRNLRDGEGWHYGAGSVRSVVTPEFKSLAQIKDTRDQIATEEDLKELKEQSDYKLIELAEKFAPYHYASKGNRFTWVDLFSEFMKDLGRNNIREWLEVFNPPVPDELMQEARDFLAYLRTMPTEYFEVKMRRAVDVSEFKAALVPTNASKETVQILKDAGLQVVRYKKDPEGKNRLAALDKVHDQVKFQKPLDMFYSQLLRSVKEAKQQMAPPADWKHIIRKMHGVTEEEIFFLGIDEWLDFEADRGVRQVSRNDLADFISGNGLKLEFRMRSGDEPDYYIDKDNEKVEPTDDWLETEIDHLWFEAIEQIRETDGYEDDDPDPEDYHIRGKAMAMAMESFHEDNNRVIATLKDDRLTGDDFHGEFDTETEEFFIDDVRFSPSKDIGISEIKAMEIANQIGASTDYADVDGPAAHEQYTEGGGEGYFEGLIIAENLHKVGRNQVRPTFEQTQRWDALNNRIDELSPDGRIPSRFDPDSKDYWEAYDAREALAKEMGEPKDPYVEDAHFEEENVLFHFRMKLRKTVHGETVAYMEEFQSDLTSYHRGLEAPEITEKRRKLKEQKTDVSERRSDLDYELKKYLNKRLSEDAENAPENIDVLIFRGVLHYMHTGAQLRYNDERSQRCFDWTFDQLSLANVIDDAVELAGLGAQEAELDNELLRLGADKSYDPSIPHTPFEGDSLYRFGMKAVLRWCVENKIHRLDWPEAQVQSKRWNRAGQEVVDEFSWETNDAGEKTVELSMHKTGALDVIAQPNGVITYAQDHADRLVGKSLSDLLGPKVAAKIMTEESGQEEGSAITFSDSGYHIVYEQKIPSALNKIGKKFKAKTTKRTDLEDFGARLVQNLGRSMAEKIEFDELRSRISAHIGEERVLKVEKQVEEVARQKKADIEYNIRVLEESIANPSEMAQENPHLIETYKHNLEKRKKELDDLPQLAAKARAGRLATSLTTDELNEIFPEARYVEPGKPVFSFEIPEKMRAAMMEPMSIYRRETVNDKLRKVHENIAKSLLPGLKNRLERLNIKDVDLGVDFSIKGTGATTISRSGDIGVLIGHSIDPKHTLDHEAIHVLRARNLFTEDEWEALRAEAERDWIYRYDIENRYDVDERGVPYSRDAQVEEAVAEAFADYARSIEANRNTAVEKERFSPQSRVTRALRKIGKFFQAIRAVFVKQVAAASESTKPLYDQVFEAIESGMMGRRPAGYADFSSLPRFRKAVETETSDLLADTVVKDENGAPERMYHGSIHAFSEFDKDKIRPTDYDAPFNGFWFSSNPKTSPAMIDPRVIMPVFLDVKNPAPADVYRTVARDVRNEDADDLREESRSYDDEVRYRLQDMGYDGIIWEDRIRLTDQQRSAYETNGSVIIKTVKDTFLTLKKGQTPERDWKKSITYERDFQVIGPNGDPIHFGPFAGPIEFVAYLAAEGYDFENAPREQLSELVQMNLETEFSMDLEISGDSYKISNTLTEKEFDDLAYTGKMLDVVDLYQGSEFITGYEDLDDFERMHSERVVVAFEPDQIISAFDPGLLNSLDIIRYQKVSSAMKAEESLDPLTADEWARGSHVVDPSGNLLRVYHGTKRTFDTFSKDEIGSRFGADKMGFYFSGSSSEASRYARGYDENTGDQVVPVYLSIKKPFSWREKYFQVGGDHDAPQAEIDAYARTELGGRSAVEYYETYRHDEWLEMMSDDDYDGFIISDPDSPTNSLYVPFEPDQIKSVFGYTAEKARIPHDEPWIERALNTEGFAAWNEGNKLAVDGIPPILWHGTTRDFEKFSHAESNIESDLGGGFYLTDTVDDANDNYAGFGPDLTDKIVRHAEIIADELSDERGKEIRYDDPEVKELAKKRFADHEGMLLPVFATMKNPLIIGGDNHTFIDTGIIYNYEGYMDEARQQLADEDDNHDPEEYELIQRATQLADENEDFTTEGGLHGIMEAIEELESSEDYWDIDTEKLKEDLEYILWEGAFADDLIKKMKASYGLCQCTYFGEDKNTGDLASGEVIRMAFEAIGYDGIIDHTVNKKFGSESEAAIRYGNGMEGMEYDTTHYVVFNPSQIKSVFNTGSFNPDDARILHRQGNAVVDRVKDTLPFKAWFGDSKATDALGNPLVVYHGSDSTNQAAQEFAFETGRAGRRIVMLSDFATVSSGIFMTENKDDAFSYGEDVGEYFLRVENPLIDPRSLATSSKASPEEKAACAKAWGDVLYIFEPVIATDNETYWQIDTDGGVFMSEAKSEEELMNLIFQEDMIEWHHLDVPEVVARMKERGYDGAKVTETHDQQGWSWFVTNPRQIKSVDNFGSFSRDDARVFHRKPDQADIDLMPLSKRVSEFVMNGIHIRHKGYDEYILRDQDRSLKWYNDGGFQFLKGKKLHSEHGPAVINSDGQTVWALDGKVTTQKAVEALINPSKEDAEMKMNAAGI